MWVLHKISVVVADVPFEIFHLLLGVGECHSGTMNTILSEDSDLGPSSRVNAALFDVTQMGGMKSRETYDCVNMKKGILNNNIFMSSFTTAQKLL